MQVHRFCIKAKLKNISQQINILNFGFDEYTMDLQKNTCDNVSVNEITAPKGSRKRMFLDRFVKISDLLMNYSESPQHQSAKLLINETEGNLTNKSADFSILQKYVSGVLCHSTGGKNWLNQDNWLTTTHECNWYGINCYKNNTIREINLSGNNLIGVLPFEIGELKALQRAHSLKQ